MIIPYQNPNSNQTDLYAIIDCSDEQFRLERRMFHIGTYADFHTSKKHWERNGIVNRFIAQTFDRDEKDYLMRLFVRAKRDLDQVRDNASFINAIVAIDEKIAKTFGKLQMADRLFDYVYQDKQIIIPDLTDVGTRPQDTPEKTFYEDEYRIIYVIVIIAKMLFPIFGEIIYRVSSTKYADKLIKEIMAFGIIKSLLNRDFSPITNKLYNYISKIVGQSLDQDPMVSFYGITETSLLNNQLSKMIVKNFVNIDLYQDNGNIMRYIAVSIKRAIRTESMVKNKPTVYNALILPESGGEDGRNISLLENSVNMSAEPVETSIIAKLAIDTFVNQYIQQNNIRQDVFTNAESFYNIMTLPPTPINELIVAMFIAGPVGSAYCVKYMNMQMMIRVVTLIQIYAMQMGFNDIVPLLSVIPTTTIKTTGAGPDNDILIHEGRGTNKVNYFLHLQELTAHLADFTNFNFNELINDLLHFVVGTVHTFNVAPSVLNIGNTGATQSDDGVLTYDNNIISELHRFMYHLLITDPERRIE